MNKKIFAILGILLAFTIAAVFLLTQINAEKETTTEMTPEENLSGLCTKGTLPNVDLETFEIVNRWHIAKDKNDVYIRNAAMECVTLNITSEGLEYLGGQSKSDDSYSYYIKNINSVYSITGAEPYIEQVAGADLATFSISTNGTFTAFDADNNYVQAAQIDTDTFEDLGEYAKDKNHVYSSTQNNKWNQIMEGLSPETFSPAAYEWMGFNMPEIDSQTFEVIDSTLAADAYQGYLKYTDCDIAADACTQTYIVIDINTENLTFVAEIPHTGKYYKTNNEVYFVAHQRSSIELVEAADPSSFTADEDNIFTGKDASNYYVRDKQVDMDSFEEFDSYAKDRNNVYAHIGSYGTPQWSSFFEDLNGSTFVELDKQYGTDGTYVVSSCFGYEYSCYTIIDGADASTFEVMDLEPALARDSNNIYIGPTKFEGVDLNSFSEYSSINNTLNLYTDKDAIYIAEPRKVCRLEDFDTETFELISSPEYGLLEVKDAFGEYEIIIEYGRFDSLLEATVIKQ